MKLVTAEQMREIDRVTIAKRGVPGITLMRAAGRAVAQAVAEIYEPDSVAVVTGKGNNAGDGFVAAVELHRRGIAVAVFLLDDPDNLRDDAAQAYAEFAKLRWPGPDSDRTEAPEAECGPREVQVNDAAELAPQLPQYDVIIDALFGTGLHGPLEGLWADAVAAMNSAHVPLVAVDIPSGLPAEPLSREMLAARPVVRASRTVTIGRPKVGMFVGAGVACTGSVSVEEIGFPLDLLEAPHIAVNLMTMDEARALLPPRDPAGHKGTFGKVLLAAGSAGMTGAAVLAARAAMRSGAGLVYSAYPEPLSAIMESHLIEPVKLPLPGAAPWFTGAQAAEVLALAAGMQAVGIGPGLGQRPETAEFVRAVVRGVCAPLVVDADGLNLLSGMLEVLAERTGETILTPHPGEAARLLGLPDAAAVETDRLGAFVEFARRHRCVVVLKGAQTVITTPDGARWVNPTGGSGLAKGGSGDVLTGMLTALLGQGLPAAVAARLGVFAHGMAGDHAAQELTARAMVAGDLIEIGLPRAFKALERA